jgi:plastocyanin
MQAYVASVKEMQNKAAFLRVATTVTGLGPEIISLAYKYLYFDSRLDLTAIARASALGPEYGFAKADVSGQIGSIIDFSLLTKATGKSRAALTGTPAAALAQVRPLQATTVNVTITDKAFNLSAKRVSSGMVVFNLINKGKQPHTFSIDGKTSGRVGPGKIGQIRVTLDRGRHPYTSTIKGQGHLKGTLTVS